MNHRNYYFKEVRIASDPFPKVLNPDAPRLGFALFETWNWSFLFAGWMQIDSYLHIQVILMMGFGFGHPMQDYNSKNQA